MFAPSISSSLGFISSTTASLVFFVCSWFSYCELAAEDSQACSSGRKNYSNRGGRRHPLTSAYVDISNIIDL